MCDLNYNYFTGCHFFHAECMGVPVLGFLIYGSLMFPHKIFKIFLELSFTVNICVYFSLMGLQVYFMQDTAVLDMDNFLYNKLQGNGSR